MMGEERTSDGDHDALADTPVQDESRARVGRFAAVALRIALRHTPRHDPAGRIGFGLRISDAA